VGACRIADSSAVKPDDWDEDAPQKIEDSEAEKPEGWLDDEPAEITDPGWSCACIRASPYIQDWIHAKRGGGGEDPSILNLP